MRLTRLTLVLLLGMAWTSLAWSGARSDAVFHESFGSRPASARLKFDPRRWRTDRGFIRTMDGRLSMRTFRIEGLSLDNWRFSFSVKRFFVPDGDQHFGVIFTYDDGTSLRIYCRGAAVYYWDKAGAKTFGHSRLGGELRKPLSAGEQAPWSSFAITTQGAYVRVDLDGRQVGTIRREAARLKAAEVYAYHLDCGFDDIKIERLSVGAARKPPVAQLAFHAAFDNTATARRGAEGAPTVPVGAEGLVFTDGVFGQAVRISRDASERARPVLQYEAGDAFTGSGGAVMFWFRPEWDGAIEDPKHFPWYGLFQALDGGNKPLLRIWQWSWLRADLSRGEELKRFSLYNRCRGSWLRGDWHHVAVVWNENGWCKLYADGIPYERGLTGERYLPKRNEASLTSVKTFCLGAKPGKGDGLGIPNGAFDELRIYRSPLSAEDVVAEIRKARPVDLILERRFVPANREGTVTLGVYPGGQMVIPPVGKDVATPIAVRIHCRLVADDTRRTIVAKDFSEEVRGEVQLRMDIPPLPPGDYRLTCGLRSGKAATQRSFRIVAYELEPPAEESANGLSLGDPITVVNCGRDGVELLSNTATVARMLGGVAYREAGANKADRFAFEITFPEDQAQGEPTLLEIAWPDDKPRSMGLYMYPESDSPQHRDRLEGGIQSGEEYPVSGAVQTARYLFYPARRRYLFEARTMATRMPAAVASVTVRPLTARLPRLAVSYPKGCRHRVLGHMDEDQSFEILFGKKSGSDQAVRYLEKLCDYFDYTGQEVMSYPLLRYHAAYYPAADSFSGGGLRPAGWIDLFLQVFRSRGKRLIASVDLYTLPELYLFPDRVDAFVEEGLFSRDAQGDLVRRHSGYVCNPVHPTVRAAFLKHVGEVLRRYGHRKAFGGVDLWLSPVWTFVSLDHGYDDFTVGQFEAETGESVPEGGGRDRFGARHAFLSGPALEAWLAWRAGKTTALLAEISRMAAAVRPDLPVYVSLPVHPWDDEGLAPTLEAHYYRDFCIDAKALRKLDSVVLVPQRYPTDYRHKRHWDNSESRDDEVSFNRLYFGMFRAPGRASSASFLRYFESFNNSLKPEVYNSYFQNADVKAHGRFFLKEFALCLAAMDTTQMLIGAQPLGTAGRDEVTRELARAYCALPAVGFETTQGSPDPVTVRHLRTADGLYVYAVNTIGSSLNVALRLSRGAKGVELSTGRAVKADGGEIAIGLKPFQLRSFRFTGKGLTLRSFQVSVPAETEAWYRKRIEGVESGLRAVADTGADVSALRRQAAALRRALDAGVYAEAHRLLFSKAVRELGKLSQAAQRGHLAEQSRMIANSTYAVNCGLGGYTFYRSDSGTLFFPDQRFVRGSYGYHGSYRSVTRSVSDIVGAPDPTLYATEAYDIDGYRFTVKTGSYTVRLYLKVGYRPSAKPGIFVIDVDLEGKRVLDKADVFLMCGGELNRAIVKEFPGIAVADGVLDIRFGYPPGGHRTARLCNAIEVIPQQRPAPVSGRRP